MSMASLAHADVTIAMAQTSWTGIHMVTIPKRNPRTLRRTMHTCPTREMTIMFFDGKSHGYTYGDDYGEDDAYVPQKKNTHYIIMEVPRDYTWRLFT